MPTDERSIGRAAFARGDFAAALAAFERSIASGDRSTDIAVLRAAALAQLGRVAEARAALREVLREHVGCEPALELLEQLDALAPEVDAPIDGAWRVGAVAHDRWEIFGSAEGGMGRVWFVRDRAWNGRELAVKSLRADAGDPQHADRARALFRRESQVWLDLGGHPNIVSGFYTIELDDALRFFMEYVPGRNLAAWLSADRRLGLAAALDQAIQLAAGMEYVHARGMVHRDLKPANCLVMADRTLRITDFGLSKTAFEGDARVAPMRGISDGIRGDMSVASAGTPAYMAPEQWRSLGDAGAPADVYAIGATLFELLVGELPFGADRAAWQRLADRMPPAVRAIASAEAPVPALVVRMLHEQVAPPTCAELGVVVPADVDALVAACLAKHPAARPTAGQLREALLASYARHVGAYPRELPSSLAPTPTGENNRAVSYFVMGETGKARSILDGVLARDATALFPWINRAQLAIASGELEPTIAAEQLDHFILVANPDMDRDRDVAAFRAEIAHHHHAHDAPVLAIAAPPGRFASLLANGRAYRWIAGTPQLVGEFVDATGVAFARGQLAIGAGTTIALVDEHGARRDLAAPAPVTALAARDAGALVVAGDADGGVAAWRLETGASLRLRGVRGLVRAVACCATTDLVAAASADGGFAVWNGRGERLLDDRVGGLACHVNGEWGIAVLGGIDGIARVFDLGTRRPIAMSAGHERAITGIAFLSDGTMVTSSSDGTVRSWDARAGRLRRTWQLHRGPIRTLAVERGDVVVTAGDDLAIRRLAPLAPRRPARLVVREDISALARRSLLVERDALIARIAGGDAAALGEAARLRARSAELARDAELRDAEDRGAAAIGVPVGVASSFTRWSRQLPWPAKWLALHPSGGGLAVAGDLGDDSELQLWDAAGTHRATLRMPRVLALAWSRDARALVVAGLDNNVRRVVVPSLAVEWTGAWAGRGGVRALACGRGDELVGAGWSRAFVRSSMQATGVIRTWSDGDTSSREIDRRGDEMVALATTSDGSVAAAARDDGKIALVDLATRARRGGELQHDRDVVALAFSRDGRRLVAASAGGAWSAWSAPFDGPPVRGRHEAGITAARLWANDRFVVTSGRDGTTRIWDVASAAAVGAIRGHAGAVLCDAQPNVRELVTAGDDRVLHRWHVELDWTLGADALADAASAIAGGTSRAWRAAHESDRALDVWRDVEAAARLAAWPAQHGALRAAVIETLVDAAVRDRARVLAQIAGSSLAAEVVFRIGMPL
jgi:serine/threonine protein kinase/WD40 repeat protein